ncbi:MurR/RpiR family transcriptional regulator [Ochrobactrum sp. Marseille-Q0166]|uniref:MurR/RpiR family transcriptional regulator n=1 Tax=Ochrobactrum sp. Marseille-Q0166 TaxID=2761105 RepID=UPI00165529D2|nr:MurR/RpiR family transcriptional regulator [Ochrobactrum sp. Marseille-Q0166]MBC8716383.1 MurR/RpiR family transcriptional regulator [Ochrobactrum sp. Marseille-Q0166]
MKDALWARNEDEQMLGLIRGSLNQFTAAERKVAETILANPQAAIAWSINDAARFSQVSEPSIMRFCRRMGFDGYSDFRMRLAQALAVITQETRQKPSDEEDPITSAILSHCNTAIESINDLSMDIDSEAIGRAVGILTASNRVDVYGHGGSGFLAAEAQHRFAFLGIASVAYSDPALQMVSALALSPGDTVFALSFSGVTTHLMPNLELARNAGASIVSLAPSESAIARMANVNIAINAYRHSTTTSFLPNERVSMYVMLDAIMALVNARRKQRSRGQGNDPFVTT